MPTDRIVRLILLVSIPVALVALAENIREDLNDWAYLLHGHRIVIPKPVTVGEGILVFVVWSLPTAVVLGVVARRKLWSSRIAIGAIASWGLFTLYSWAVILQLVFYSRIAEPRHAVNGSQALSPVTGFGQFRGYRSEAFTGHGARGG
jgi:hypothetical protein